tara:strand:- start:7361 stop:7555 length:195 start_codon:yes stop_codon:yes gene_type:complete
LNYKVKEKKMKIITILEFSTGKVYIIPVTSNESIEDLESYLIDKGYDTSNSEWMVSDFNSIIIK